MINSNRFLIVDGHPGLVRDKSSGAILNVNKQEIAQARSRKKVWKEQQEELEQLRSDVAYMKEALAQLLEDRNGNNSN
jgi:hypothetical protein